MGERAHTKGPWRLDGAVIRGTKADGKERPIVEVWRRVGGIDQEAIANANLCLAAPDMFEALEAARQFIANGIELGFIRMPDVDTPDPAHGTLPAIDAALAKASASASSGRKLADAHKNPLPGEIAP